MHYKQCVLGPVAMPSMNIGYPDGDNRPTVTMDYRRTYTMTPDSSGRVAFGIGTGYHGCFIKGIGSLTTSAGFTPVAITSGGGFQILASTTTAGDTDMGLVPIVSPVNYTSNTFPAYRPLVAVADVVFTGSSMYNGGSVVVAKTSTANTLNGVYSSADVPSYLARGVNPAITATSVVGAARDSYTSRVVPADPEFIPFQVAATDASASSPSSYTNALISPGFTTERKVNTMPCEQAGAIWYDYSGLDASASITVTVRYCVQYSVRGDSEFVPIARPSPPPPDNPGVLSRVFSAITNSPAALQFAANTVGHLMPASRPLLSIAAEAYNHAH